MKTITLPVKGLNFAGCAREIEKQLGKLELITQVAASYVSQTVTITYDETRLSEAAPRERVQDCGFACAEALGGAMPKRSQGHGGGMPVLPAPVSGQPGHHPVHSGGPVAPPASILAPPAPHQEHPPAIDSTAPLEQAWHAEAHAHPAPTSMLHEMSAEHAGMPHEMQAEHAGMHHDPRIFADVRLWLRGLTHQGRLSGCPFSSSLAG